MPDDMVAKVARTLWPRVLWETYADAENAARAVIAATDREELVAEVERLRKALVKIKDVPTKEWSIDTAHALARAALKGNGNG